MLQRNEIVHRCAARAPAAQRFRLSDSFGPTCAGVLLGAGYLALLHFTPGFTASSVIPFLTPSLPPEAYLWIFLPLLSRLGVCKPLPCAHQWLVACGGVRGPVTLTLAICVARNEALSPGTRAFAAAMAAAFVLLNLLCNGLMLGRVARWLGIAQQACGEHTAHLSAGSGKQARIRYSPRSVRHK